MQQVLYEESVCGTFCMRDMYEVYFVRRIGMWYVLHEGRVCGILCIRVVYAVS